MLISDRCISGFMSNLIKKSWTVSSIDRGIKDCTETASFAENLLEGKVSDIFSRMPHCRKVKIFTIKWNKSLERHFYSAGYYHLHIFKFVYISIKFVKEIGRKIQEITGNKNATNHIIQAISMTAQRRKRYQHYGHSGTGH